MIALNYTLEDIIKKTIYIFNTQCLWKSIKQLLDKIQNRAIITKKQKLKSMQ